MWQRPLGRPPYLVIRRERIGRRGTLEVTESLTIWNREMFVSSYDPVRLTPAQWLLLVRSHWGVESSHHTLDTAIAEDDRPWIEADSHGMLAVLLLRRIAFTLLALFRAASRTDEGRVIRWRALLAWVRDALVAATEDQLAGLREIAAATR